MRIFPLEIGRHCLLPEAKIVLEYGRESLDSVDLECVVLGNIETIQAGMVYTGKERVMAQRVGSIEKGILRRRAVAGPGRRRIRGSRTGRNS